MSHGIQEFARSIVETVRHPLVILDADQKVVSANSLFYQMLGEESETALGRSLYELDDRRWDLPQLREKLRDVLIRGESFEGLEIQFDPPRRGQQYAILSARQVERGEDKSTLVLLALEDDTERQRAREQLRRLNSELELRVARRTAQLKAANDRLSAANQEMEAFCYSVSHDLRAPLRAIDGFSQELLESHAHNLDQQGHHYLRRVRAGVQRMGQLIDDLLQLSRVTRAGLHTAEVDFSALVRRIAAELQYQQPQRRLTFTADSGMTAICDPGLIEVALRNLLENAWKFTSRNAEAVVHVGHIAQQHATEFWVRDNGAGFDPAYSDKLFGAFQRLHSDREFPGTGIGLATVKRIVHRHGGTVWAEGKLGGGATFHFTIPQVDDEQ